MDLALTIGAIGLIFFAFFVGLTLLARWSEKHDRMQGDFGDRFRLWKQTDRED